VPVKVGMDFAEIVEHWLHAMDIWARDSAYLRSFKVVTYESLTAEPRRVLDALQNFLGISAEPLDTTRVRDASTVYDRYWEYFSSHGRSRYVRLNGDRRRDRAYEVLERLVAPISSRSAMRRLQDLEPRLNGYGYSLGDLHACRLRDDA
jgi:hypothetical protein